MNAPVLILAVDEGASLPPTATVRETVGFSLYDIALSGGIALSDRYGCWTAMCGAHPSPLGRADREGAEQPRPWPPGQARRRGQQGPYEIAGEVGRGDQAGLGLAPA